jgi:hypothetical protein
MHARSVGFSSFRCVVTVLCPCHSALGGVTRGRSVLSSPISARSLLAAAAWALPAAPSPHCPPCHSTPSLWPAVVVLLRDVAALPHCLWRVADHQDPPQLLPAPHCADVSCLVHWTATGHYSAVISRRVCTLAQHRRWPAGRCRYCAHHSTPPACARTLPNHTAFVWGPAANRATFRPSSGQPAGPLPFSPSLLYCWVN